MEPVFALGQNKAKMLEKMRIYAAFVHIFAAVGTAGGICLLNLLPLALYRYKVDLVVYQQALALLSVPWTSQAIVGAVSDTFPIRLWYKRYYLIASFLAFSFGLLVTGIITTAPWGSFSAATAALSICSFSVVVIVTLADGHAANLQTYFNINRRLMPFNKVVELVGSILAAVIVGSMAGAYENYVYFIAVPFALQALYPLVVSPHDSFPGDHRTEFKDESLIQSSEGITWYRPESYRISASKEEWRLVKLLSLLGIVMIIPIAASDNIFVYVLVASFVGIASIAYLMSVYPEDPAFYSVCTFVMLNEIFNTNIKAALDAFYTMPDSPVCKTGGPQLDLLFYFSTVTLLTGVGGVASATLYAFWADKFTVRQVTQAAIVIGMLSSFADISIAMEWSSIPDKFLFVLGDGVVAPAARIMIETATEVWVANSIKSAVTTKFAIFSSFKNLGALQSYVLGLMLTKGMGVQADMDTGCSYISFVKLVMTAKLCLPILAIGAAYILLPNAPLPATIYVPLISKKA